MVTPDKNRRKTVSYKNMQAKRQWNDLDISAKGKKLWTCEYSPYQWKCHSKWRLNRYLQTKARIFPLRICTTWYVKKNSLGWGKMIPDGNLDLHKWMKNTGNRFGTSDSIYRISRNGGKAQDSHCAHEQQFRSASCMHLAHTIKIRDSLPGKEV